MPPLSYALLNEVLQYPETPKERVSYENTNNIAQNTNIVNPNKNIPVERCGDVSCGLDKHNLGFQVLNPLNNFKEFFTDANTGASLEVLLREQIFLTKILIFILMFVLLLNILQRTK